MKLSLSGRTPDDESNNNTGHSQYDKQDANLLPGAPLGGKLDKVIVDAANTL